jgi:hypothetical protein
MMFFKAQDKDTLPQLRVSSSEKGILLLTGLGVKDEWDLGRRRWSQRKVLQKTLVS